MYPPAFSLSLEADRTLLASELQPDSNAGIDLAHEKLANWTLRTNTDVPFWPDFTLFEPVEPIDIISHKQKTHHHNVLDLKSRQDTSLSDRLVYLIRYNPDAAEQLRSGSIQNGITLPINIQITSYCFPLCDLQHVNSLDIRPHILISKVHLNHILKSSPLDLVDFEIPRDLIVK